MSDESNKENLNSDKVKNDASHQDHIWSLEEIRKNAENWSLAADIGLLAYMENFASKLTSQAHEISRNVSKLVHDTKSADAKLQTATNSFMSLSDTQFIENRVYDEDSPPNQEEEKKDEENLSAEEIQSKLQSNMKEAIKVGLGVVENCYDVLEVGADDSDIESDDDDDSEPAEFILEAKDPYINRPLPHLIGSRPFMETEDVGIGDLEDTEDESETDSVSESEDEIEKAVTVSDATSSLYTSDEDVSDDSAAVDAKQKSLKSSSSSDQSLSSDEEDLDDEDLFKPSSTDILSQKKDLKKSSTKKEKKESDFDMFAEKEEDDLFAPTSGMFGSGRGLFDVEATTGDLFEGVDEIESDKEDFKEVEESAPKEVEAPVPKLEKTTKKPPAGGVNLFGGVIKKNFFNGDDSSSSDEDLFTKEDPKHQVVKTSKDNLFDESEESDEDLFASAGKPLGESIPGAKVEESKSSLFAGSDLDEDEDEDQLFGSSQSKTASVTMTTPSSKTKSSLFDEDDEKDDFFGEEIPKKVTSGISEDKKRPVGGVSMFGAGGSDLLKAALKKKAKRSSSSESSSSEVTATSKPQAVKKGTFASTQPLKIEVKTTAKDLIFNSSDEESDKGIFKSVAKPKKSNFIKSSKNSQNLFSTGSSEDDLFSSSSKLPLKSSKKLPKTSIEKKTRVSGSQLFLDDDEDLFDSKIKKSSEKKTKSLKSDLFAVSESSSDDDLFAFLNSRPKVKEQKPDVDDQEDEDDLLVSEKTEDKPLTKATTKGLFDASDEEDDEEDDLFNIQPTPKISKEVSKSSSSLVSSSEDTTEITETVNKISSPSPLIKKKPPAGAVAVFAPPVGASKPLKSVDEVEDTGRKVDVSKLRKNLFLNPKSLLPGERPTISRSSDPNTTLECFTKQRSRGQTGRRPPTRQGRRNRAKAAEKDSLMVLPEVDTGSSPSVPASTVKSSSHPPKIASQTSKSLFEEDKDDLFLSQKTNQSLSNSLFDDQNKDDDIFTSSTTKERTSSKLKNKLSMIEDEDDLFKDMGFSTSKSKPSLFGDDDEDDEDIFASSFKPKKDMKKISKKRESKKVSIFDDDDDDVEIDDDIFSSFTSKKGKSEIKITKEQKQSKKDVDFEDPLNALFK